MIKLYVSGFAGNLGTKVLIDKKQDELVRQFNQEFITHLKNQIEKSLSKDGFNPSLIMSSCNPHIVDCENVGKGGVLASLWKLCERNKWGLKYSLRRIPILQGTVEIANYFDINPYRLLTKNSFIVAIKDEQNDNNDKLIVAGTGELCESQSCMGELCEPQSCMGEPCEPQLTYIGDITNERKRIRIDGEVEAFLTKDYKDEIDKVISNYIKIKGLV